MEYKELSMWTQTLKKKYKEKIKIKNMYVKYILVYKFQMYLKLFLEVSFLNYKGICVNLRSQLLPLTILNNYKLIKI